MNKTWLLGGSVAALAAIAALSGFTSDAATNRYNFVLRGIVTEVNTADKTITLDVTNTTGKAKEDPAGTNTVFQASSATIFKRVALLDKRVTFSNIAVGQELGVKGVAKNDDKYYITWLRIHDRSFDVVGLLKQHDTVNKTITVLIQSSSYKNEKYKGLELEMHYDDNSTFYNNNGKNEVVYDDVDANDQKVKVTGTVTGSNTWEVKKLIDGYKGK